MYIGKVQWAVEGRVIFFIKAGPSSGCGTFNHHSLHYLSMSNFNDSRAIALKSA
jgi:hypothetical protein